MKKMKRENQCLPAANQNYQQQQQLYIFEIYSAI